MKLEIVKYENDPDKILLQPTISVEHINDNIIQLLSSMDAKMRDMHAVGIAANQVGYRHKMCVILDINDQTLEKMRLLGQIMQSDNSSQEQKDNTKEIYNNLYDNIQSIFLINPKIIEHSNTTNRDAEGCLSLKISQRKSVQRYDSITVSFQNIKNQKCKQVFSGFTARIFQHENDHLLGISMEEYDDFEKNIEDYDTTTDN